MAELKNHREKTREFREPNIDLAVNLEWLPQFSWDLCTLDPDNPSNILLWRKISKTTPEQAIKFSHLSHLASRYHRNDEQTDEAIRKEIDQAISVLDRETILRESILPGKSDDKPDIVLHTTYNQDNARRVPFEGVIVEYSIPKQYILDHEPEIMASTGGEAELAFLYGIKGEMIKKITSKKNGQEITESREEIESRIQESLER